MLMLLHLPVNLGISFDPELSFKRQIDMVGKNCNFEIHNTYAQEISRLKVLSCISSLTCDI